MDYAMYSNERQPDMGGPLEIIERQGRWLVMPGPDRRSMFFNLPGDKEATTFVMRRKDGGLVDAEHYWPR